MSAMMSSLASMISTFTSEAIIDCCSCVALRTKSKTEKKKQKTQVQKSRRRGEEEGKRMPMNVRKLWKLAKGFRGRAKNVYKVAVNRVEKALQYQYRDRRVKKRTMRTLWIERINAASRLHGIRYGQFAHGLVECNIALNRKMLAELAVNEPYSFKAVAETVKLSPSFQKFKQDEKAREDRIKELD
jgi:large subunit ribosomal protein L20